MSMRSSRRHGRSRILTIVAVLMTLFATAPTAGAVVATGQDGNAGAASVEAAILPNFSVQGSGLVRLLAGAFDPLADPLPAGAGLALVDAADLPAGTADYFIVQVAGKDFAGAQDAIAATGASLAGYVHDDAYMVRATPAQADAIAAEASVRWVGYYQPAWRVPVAVDGKQALLDLAGDQVYRVYVFRAEPDVAAVASAIGAIDGADVVSRSARVIEVAATSSQLREIASVSGVEWVSTQREIVLHNANARWVNDTGVRDVYSATADGRLTGAGQTAAVADTGINYTYDLNGRAHVAFRDCDPDGSNCKEAIYTMANPGGTSAADIDNVVDNGTGHRKMVAYFDIAGSGPQPWDTSSHGSHTGGSVTGDQGDNGTYDGHDGLAPGAKHVHQNIGTVSGGLRLPGDDYDLWRQAYRPRDPGSVAIGSPASGNGVADEAAYVPEEDARTHNNSYGLIVQVIDEGSAVDLDAFVWDHEDMVIVVSAGNSGPGLATVGSPSVAKNNLNSGAMANGRQPMASIDSMASFSSHGPTGDGRYGPDLATPGQIVVSVKGGTEDGYHVAQGTSMSAPVLTGLTTLVRQYFFDGYGPSGGSGFAGGEADPGRSHNPSAALVKAAMINGAERMRGYYTGDDGQVRVLDGQWPSMGQGYGRVTLDNSLYFTGDDLNNWYHDVWRHDAEAFTLAGGSREYELVVTDDAEPLDVTLAWTDAPDLLPAGTPALVNNLDLEVVAPNGDVYRGNDMNSRVDPSVDDAETLVGGAADVSNVSERVRVLQPQTGTWTVRVVGTQISLANQGFALAASGLIGDGFVAGDGLFSDAAGAPAISNVVVEAASGDTAMVTFDTSEATTATATVDGVTYIDSYAVSDLHGLDEGTSETSAEYADRPMVGTSHEILLTGLKHGETISIVLSATDLGGNSTSATVGHTNPANVFQPDAPDIGQLVQGSTSTNQWRTGTQLYAGWLDGDGILGAWAFRLPDGSIDPADITGASVEFTSAHDWMIRYTQDPVLQVDLLDDPIELAWGTAPYEVVADAPVDARAFPESTHLRGAHQLYSFSFTCGDLDALRTNLADGMAAFRYTSTEVTGTGLFSADFGFNRRSNGPQLRPRLVLYTDGLGHPGAQNCDPATPAPTITNVGVHDGETPDSVTVSWETDVDSSSLVLFREQGTGDWIQVGTPALTQVHHVQVFGLDPDTEYEFAVRSEACNGATSTDVNGGEGYDFFVPPPPVVPTDDWFFHGFSDDQATKAAFSPPDVPDSFTFDMVAPTGLVPVQQTTTPFANENFVGNPLSAFWRGPFTGPIDEVVELHWYWSTPNATAVTIGAEVEVSFFADPDWDGASAVQPERLIGRGVGRLFFDDVDVATLNVTPIGVNGTVENELLIQVVPVFVDTGEGLVVHYDSTETPSGFKIPQEAPPDPIEQRVLTGPQPAPSAGGSGIVVPETRTGPATAADQAAGTQWCSIPGDEVEPVDAIDDDYMTDEDTTLTVAAPGVLGNDMGSGLTASLVSGPSNGTLDLQSDGSFEYTPAPGFVGDDTFVYEASDGTTSDQATVTITVKEDGGEDDGEGRVHGAGFWEYQNAAGDTDKLNFSFDARPKHDGLTGKLKVNDKEIGVKIDSKTITSLASGDGEDCNGSVLSGGKSFVVTAAGSFESPALTAEDATFRICGEDNGNPGKGNDVLFVECLTGCTYDTGSRVPDDVLDGGNVHVKGAIGAGAASSPPSTSGDPATADGGNTAVVLELDPILLTEAPTGTPLVLTAIAHTADGLDLAARTITLSWVAADGTAGTETAVTDTVGVALFTVTVGTVDVEYLAEVDGLESNSIDVTPMF